MAFIAIGLSAGCATMEGSWEKTQRYDSVGSYKSFIREYPDSPYVSEAKRRIENLAYERAAKKDSVAAYEKFIEQYPESNLGEQARSRIVILRKEEEDRAYAEAQEADSVDKYESFLEEYPSSRYAGEAKAAIKRIKLRMEDELYQEASREASYVKLAQYKTRYPKGRYIKQVNRLLKRFRWQRLSGPMLISWRETGNGVPLSSHGLTSRLRNANQFPGASIFGSYLVGGVVTQSSEVVYVQSGAIAFGKMTVEPTQFSVVTAKNTLLKLSTVGSDDRILMIGQKVVLAVGSSITLDYAKSTEEGNTLSAVARSGDMVSMTQVSGGPDITDIGGINLYGNIYRKGSVAVTPKGLLFAKGTELLKMK
jgi:outer membrane protein assembly factor BamD (BamD/ComL family)